MRLDKQPLPQTRLTVNYIFAKAVRHCPLHFRSEMAAPTLSTILSPITSIIPFGWVGVISFAFCHVVGIVIYRRCFHPLAKIPGPFLPSVTTLYQTYYSGQYYKEIGRLHEQYGKSQNSILCGVRTRISISSDNLLPWIPARLLSLAKPNLQSIY